MQMRPASYAAFFTPKKCRILHGLSQLKIPLLINSSTRSCMKNRYRLFLGAAVLFALSHTSAQTDFYLKSGTGAVDQPSSWNDDPAGTGNDAQTSDFTGTNIWHMQNRSGAGLSTSWGLGANETLVIESNFNFTVASGGSINFFPIDIASGGTLTIEENNSYLLNSLDPTSMVVVNTSAYSLETDGGNGYYEFGNLRIASSTGVAGAATEINVNGILTIDAGVTFSLNSNYLQLKGNTGSIAGNGNIYADNQSIVLLDNGGGGNNGTLRFASGGEHLNILYISYSTPSDVIVLGSDVFIESAGFYQHYSGSVNLNGHSIEVDGSSDATFPQTLSDGVIIGDPNSSLTFKGTIGVTGSQSAGGSTLSMSPSDRRLRSLNISASNATLSMGTNLAITDSLSLLDGGLDMNGNMLVLRSNNLRKGRIARMGTNALFSGSVTAETFLSGGSTGWMNLGSPGLSGAGVTVAQWDTWYSSGGTSGVPMACTGCFFGPWTGTFTSIQDWIESSSSYSALSSSSQLVNGKGYWVYVGDGQNTTNDLTLITSGSYTADASNAPSIPLTSAGTSTDAGWNLVCNPYASPISWTSVFSHNTGKNINGTMHVWSPESSGVWGDYTQGAGSGTNGQGDVIPAGQGFYVNVTSGSPSLDFAETDKTDINSTNLLKSGANTDPNEFRLVLSGLWGDKDETMFRFLPSATQEFDLDYDGDKLFSTAGYAGLNGSYNKYTTISSKDNNGRHYSVNSLPVLKKNITLPILVRTMYTGTFSISAPNTGELATCLVLYDKLENKYQDLKKGAYTFRISDTTSIPRFELTMCQMDAGTVTDLSTIEKTNNIVISQDRDGAFVNMRFGKPTPAVISAYNIIGQELMTDVTVHESESLTRLSLDAPGQVIIVRVRTAEETVVKKLILE
jgi:hypothetical protein